MPAMMLSVSQVAELLQISRDTVYRLAGRGELKARKVGHLWRFPRHAVEQYACSESDAEYVSAKPENASCLADCAGSADLPALCGSVAD
jgi:excisionase family DNA binding protein